MQLIFQHLVPYVVRPGANNKDGSGQLKTPCSSHVGQSTTKHVRVHSSAQKPRTQAVMIAGDASTATSRYGTANAGTAFHYIHCASPEIR
jgi:hypothetical protein